MEKVNKNEIVGIVSFEESLENFKNSSDENRKIQERVDKIRDLIKYVVSERCFQQLSQRELAEMTGIKQPMIARFENAEMMPRLDTFIRITDALKLDLKISQKLDYEIDAENYHLSKLNDDIYVNEGDCYYNGTEIREYSCAQA